MVAIGVLGEMAIGSTVSACLCKLLSHDSKKKHEITKRWVHHFRDTEIPHQPCAPSTNFEFVLGQRDHRLVQSGLARIKLGAFGDLEGRLALRGTIPLILISKSLILNQP